MIALIRAMFAIPEAQSDPYVWAAALAGHWAIGAGLAALVMAIWPTRKPWGITVDIMSAVSHRGGTGC